MSYIDPGVTEYFESVAVNAGDPEREASERAALVERYGEKVVGWAERYVWEKGGTLPEWCAFIAARYEVNRRTSQQEAGERKARDRRVSFYTDERHNGTPRELPNVRQARRERLKEATRARLR